MYGIFFLLLFFPVIRFANIGIPSVAIFLCFLLFHKKIYYNRRSLAIAMLSFTVMLGLIVIISRGNTIVLKDLLYLFFPLLVFVFLTLYQNKINEKNAIRFIRFLKAFLWIQLVVVILQQTNLFGFNQIFEKYFFFLQEINAQKVTSYLELNTRPFGLVGNPVYLAILSYLFAKTIYFYEHKYSYTVLSLLLMILSGARMAILGFFLCELFLLFFQKRKNKVAVIGITIVGLGLIGFVGYQFSGFFKYYIDTFILNFSFDNFINDYSYSYRRGMLEILLDNRQFFLLGGMTTSELPSYVDSELILRILQFGIFGLGALLSVYAQNFIENFRSRTYNERLLLIALGIFLILNMITNVLFSSIFFLPYITLIFVLLSKKPRKEVPYENLAAD